MTKKKKSKEEGESLTELPEGKLTKKQLYDHFDLDGDGIVTKDDYRKHIKYHCNKEYNPYYDKEGNPNLKILVNEIVFFPNPEKIRTNKKDKVYLTPYSNKGKVKVEDQLYDFEINDHGEMFSIEEIPGYEVFENRNYTFLGYYPKK